MNFNFMYNMPTRLIFGVGKLSELAETPYLPGKKALIVIGAAGAMKKYGYLEKVEVLLKKNNVETVVFDKVLANPISENVADGAACARENSCDFVIGLGGGSSIDAAKSIAVMATNEGEYWDYMQAGTGGQKMPENRALPLVAIPTTAGTGTESDPWTVITKSETNEKIGWGCDDTFPVMSIIDPELMLSVPPKMTAYTGIDAFCHAVECYIANVNQPASDRFALEAISLITECLPIAVKDGSNLDARTKLAWASTEAGICESLSCCIAHHSMEHAISAYYPDVPHGAGLTMLSVSFFSYVAERNPERFADMARAMGEDVDSLSEDKKPFAFITGLKKLIKNIGLDDETLSNYGVKKEDIPKLAENSITAMGFLYDLTPVELTREDTIAIFERAYK